MKKERKKIFDKKQTRIVNTRLFAVLYFLCAFCCFVSGIINYNFGSTLTYIVDFVLFVVWLIFGIIYYKKGFKDKKDK